jgi:hypothetical protein
VIERFFAVILVAAVATGCGSDEADRADRPDEAGQDQRPDTAAGTGQPADPPLVDTGADPTAVPDGCEGLEETILRAAPTRAALAETFGPPDSVHAATEPNRHIPEATDSLFTVFYPGLRVDIRTPPSARDMATHVEIRDNRYIAFPAIGIGAREARLMDALGEPTRRADRSLTWDCCMHVEQPVTFHFADGAVRRIEISYYVD